MVQLLLENGRGRERLCQRQLFSFDYEQAQQLQTLMNQQQDMLGFLDPEMRKLLQRTLDAVPSVYPPRPSHLPTFTAGRRSVTPIFNACGIFRTGRLATGISSLIPSKFGSVSINVATDSTTTSGRYANFARSSRHVPPDSTSTV